MVSILLDATISIYKYDQPNIMQKFIWQDAEDADQITIHRIYSLF